MNHSPDDPNLDARLSELISDAVSDVQPRDSLDAIRTRTKVTTMSSRRPWLLATGGAVAATAAVVTAIAFAGGNLGRTASDGPGPAGSPSATTPSTEQSGPSQDPSTLPTPTPGTQAVAVYYLGDTPSGPRLYREFHSVAGMDSLALAARELTTTPQDPDYSTPWPQGAFAETSFDGNGADGLIQVTLADASLHDRPAGMSQEEAGLAIQQVVYTLQAAVQSRAPVQFFLDNNPVDQVYGVPTSEPLTNDSVLKTLSHVSLTTPTEGQVLSGSTLEVTGVANSFEANVVARLQRYEGTEIMAQQPFTAEGWMGDQLFPFSGSIDITGVPPGKYILMVMTDDPSGGAEGNGAFTDTRIVVVE